ncbi:MAG: response regulator transcription factor [Kiritimatiellae bacterium]|nr:response regulator transcription factor [Kiritimatiellia bacterium]
MKKISILIADDHALIRMGLSALLRYERDMTVVGEAEDGESAVRLAEELRPDVVIMDLKMPVLDGVEATARIHKAIPTTKVLILTTFGTSQDAARAIAAGAAGAIVKDEENTTLIDSIRKIHAGEKIFSQQILQTIENDGEEIALSPRQQQVLQSAARGLSNTDIALQYGLAKDSVKHYLSDIFQKLGAANRSEAVAIAIRKHLLKI